MPREVVVLDANAYRALGRKNLALLKARERAEGIVAQASDRVALELFAKLGREHRDPGRAISALQALEYF